MIEVTLPAVATLVCPILKVAGMSFVSALPASVTAETPGVATLSLTMGSWNDFVPAHEHDAADIVDLDDVVDAALAGYTNTYSAASSWTVNHNLGRKPSVQVLSVGNVEIDASVTHVTDNQVVVQFVSAMAGSVRCI